MTDSTPSGIGARLREVRGQASQADFAQRLGVARSSLVRYEAGERVPDAELLVTLWRMAGVDPLWLLTGAAPADAERAGSPEEARLLMLWRACGADQRAHLLQAAHWLAPSGNAKD